MKPKTKHIIMEAKKESVIRNDAAGRTGTASAVLFAVVGASSAVFWLKLSKRPGVFQDC